MNIKIQIYTLIVVALFRVAHADEKAIPEISYGEHILHSAAFTIDRLHRLKIGEQVSVEQSMENSLSADAKDMYELLRSGKVSEEEVNKIYGMLRLLSVMNEKFELVQWRSDQKLLNIFREAQENDQEHTNKLRCFNWKKPMWIEKDGCT
jgi:hypothetical protein